MGMENEKSSVILVVFNGIGSSSGKMKTQSEDVDIYSMLQICGMSSSRIQKKPKIFVSQLCSDGNVYIVIFLNYFGIF